VGWVELATGGQIQAQSYRCHTLKNTLALNASAAMLGIGSVSNVRFDAVGWLSSAAPVVSTTPHLCIAVARRVGYSIPKTVTKKEQLIPWFFGAAM
jgi:hypothetical protein